LVGSGGSPYAPPELGGSLPGPEGMAGRIAFADGVASPVGTRSADEIETLPVTGARGCGYVPADGYVGVEETGAEGTTDGVGGEPGVPLGVMIG